ncbi:MAG TPA: hypothetical protein VH599_17385 [Ktedonobacterales bacterium]
MAAWEAALQVTPDNWWNREGGGAPLPQEDCSSETRMPTWVACTAAVPGGETLRQRGRGPGARTFRSYRSVQRDSR